MKKPNIFQRFVQFIKGWYERYFEKYEPEGSAGVVTTNWIKEHLENGTFEALAYMTPSQADDYLVKKAKTNLIPLFEAYGKAHNLAVEGKSNLEIIQVIHEYILSLGSKRSFWAEISGDIIVFLADGKISWNEALILGQKLFWEFFNKKRKLA